MAQAGYAKEAQVKIQALILSTALVVPMILAGQNTNIGNNQAQNNTSQLTVQERMFLHAIASEDQSEINLANLALQKSNDPQIQQYAKSKILAADPGMKLKARQIAQQNHTMVSGSPNPAAQQEYDDFSRLSGNLFDRAYVKYEARQQGADYKIVKYETTHATNPQVVKYAQTEANPVQEAAQAAQKLAQSMHISTTS